VTTGYYLDSIWYVGDLNNGSTEIMTIIAKVESAGNFSNFVTVNSTENDTNLENNKANVTNITAPYQVDVAITKTAVIWGGESVAKVGDTIQFTINVNNYGPCNATNVTVSEVLSPLLEMYSCDTGGKGQYDVKSGVWYIGNMSSGDYAQMVILAHVISNGTISNFVSVTSNETDKNLTNNNDTIKNITALPIVDLIIVKEVNQSAVNVTKQIKFTITVINDGPCNATLVNVSEELGNHLRLISANATHGSYNVTEGIWHIGSLTNHTNATLTIICEAVRDGNFVNRVNVTCHENETDPVGNNHYEVPFTILRIVDVSITKEANVTALNVTNQIKFTITVHNSGPSNATDVRVSEFLDSHLSLVSFNVTTGYYLDSIWYVGDLNNGSTEIMTIISR
jgi:uncharacterized repeat protein (TIGR01451 family)